MRTLSPSAVLRLRRTLTSLSIVQLIFAIIVLGGSGAQAYKMVNDINFPRVPGKLGYSVFISILTFLLLPVLIILHFTSPRWWKTFTTRWSLWPAVCSSAAFAVFWIAASGTAFFNCGDMCGAELPGLFTVKYTSALCCICDNGVYETVPCGQPSSGDTVIVGFDQNVKTAYQVTQAFSILNMLTFFASTAIWIVLFQQRQRRRGSGATEMLAQEADPLPGTTAPAYNPSGIGVANYGHDPAYGAAAYMKSPRVAESAYEPVRGQY